MPTALTFGNFDGVHLGHLQILNHICSLATCHGLSSAVITFSPHPACYFYNKSDFLILDPQERLSILKNYVDAVYLLDFDKIARLAPEEFVTFLCHKLDPRFIVVGPSCKFGKNALGDIKTLKFFESKFNYNTVEVLSQKKNELLCSSTNVRAFLKAGKIKAASNMLGREYYICGVVKKERGLGLKIGFPTINLRPKKELILPQYGVYLGKLKFEDKFFDGLINVGTRPTTTNKNEPVVEVHALNFCQNIYGKSVSIFFQEFIRSEKKFDSVESLVAQIKQDIKFAKSQLKLQSA